MSKKRTNDPFWWTLFGAGGVISAFFLPVHAALLGLAIPLGVVEAPGYQELLELTGHPLARLYFFAVISLSLFHWAHRFRYTLYDGLKLKHLEVYIIGFCYGVAIIGTILSAVLVITL